MLAQTAALYLRMLQRLVGRCGKHPRSVLAGAVLIALAALFYAFHHLGLDTSTTDMLDPKLRFLQLQDQLDRAFPELTGLLVVVVDARTATGAQEVADALAARMRRESDLYASVYQPGQGPFFEHNALLYLDEQQLWQLNDRLAQAAPFIGTVAQDPSLRGLLGLLGRAMDEPLDPDQVAIFKDLLTRLAAAAQAQNAGRPYQVSWSADLIGGTMPGEEGNRAFILAKPRLDYSGLQPGLDAVQAVHQLAGALRIQASDVRVRVTGSVAMEAEELGSIAAGAGRATALSFILVTVLLLTGLRSVRLSVSVVVTLVIGLLWTAGFAALTVGRLNLISVTFAILFIGLGVDFGIQFAMRYREECSSAHLLSERVGCSRAVARIGNALTLAASAAALSFLSFVPTEFGGLAELGLISSAGMFFALAANLTVLPALIALLGFSPARSFKPGALEGIGAFTKAHRRAIVAIAAVLGTGALVLFPHLRFDFSPLNLRDPTTESVQTFRDLLKSPDSTPYTIEVLTPSLSDADRLVARLEKLHTVDKAVTLTSYVPEQQDDKLAIIRDLKLLLPPLVRGAGAPAPPTLAEQRAALQQFLATIHKAIEANRNPDLQPALREVAAPLQRLTDADAAALEGLQRKVIGDLPEGLKRLQALLSPQHVTLADLPADLRARYVTPDGRARVEVYPAEDLTNNAALRTFVHEVQRIAPNAADTPVTLLGSGDAVIHASLQAAVTAFLAAVVLLLVVLRSALDTALVMLPLMLATALTAACSVLLRVPFNFANVIAIPLLVGLGIAFGIYIVMRKRDGVSVEQLFQSSTPRAVLFSALTTMASFGTLAVSPHRGMSSMGILLSLALFFALICTLLVLPAIIAVIEARRPQRAPQQD